MTTMNGMPPAGMAPAGMPQGMRSLGRIGLWGAPSSGKTTFLAALNIAVNRMGMPGLMIYGVDDESTAFLADNTSRLTKDRQFPPATQAQQQLSWVMRMQTEAWARNWRGKRVMSLVPQEFNLDLLDAPGDSFADVPVTEAAASAGDGGRDLWDDDEDDAGLGTGLGMSSGEDDIMDQLASCDGLLLLFDPTKEWKDGDAFNYFQGTLLRIAQRRMAGQSTPGGLLPHYVAVCATKFDHPDVYRRAKTRGYRSFAQNDPYLFPRVPDERAEAFFLDLVQESERGNADLVASALRGNFQPGRVKFFITSAIGFYKSHKSARFKEGDFMNMVPQDSGAPRIRGSIYPINVVEPLLWLAQRISEGR